MQSIFSRGLPNDCLAPLTLTGRWIGALRSEGPQRVGLSVLGSCHLPDCISAGYELASSRGFEPQTQRGAMGNLNRADRKQIGVVPGASDARYVPFRPHTEVQGELRISIMQLQNTA
jgi:hypothetical protein